MVRSADIRRRIDKPWTTVDRQCKALHMLGVTTVAEVPYGNGDKSRWYYSLAEGIDPSALQTSPEMLVGGDSGDRESASPYQQIW